MKNKFNIKDKSSNHNFNLSCVAILLVCLMLATCKSDNNISTVEFLCLDQSGTPIKQAEVTFNGTKQQSDDQGLCHFRVDLDRSNLRMFVNADAKDHQFVGPDSVYLTKGELLKYALNFFNDQLLQATDYTDGSDKIALEFISPDTFPTPPPPPPSPDTIIPKPATKYSLTVNSIPELSEVTIYERKMYKKKVKISERIVADANKRRAPFKILLAKGNYRINGKPLEFKYYKPIDEYVNLVSDHPVTLKHPIWQVDLVITNIPVGAEILVNNKSTLIKEIPLKAEGIYAIDIKKNGFQTKKYVIDFHPATNKGIIINADKLEIPYNKKIPIDATLQKL